MEHTLEPGDGISRYTIVGALGSGGLGEVYLAQDLTLERSVAPKILPPQLVRNKGEDLKDLSRDGRWRARGEVRAFARSGTISDVHFAPNGTRVSFVYGTSSKDVVLISDFQ